MKNFNKFIYYFLLLSFPLFQACENPEEQIPVGEYDHGVVIVNEGNFTKSDASLSFYNPITNEVQNDVFNKVNDRPVGSVLQSVHFVDGKGYLVVNNSNKIEVVNEADFSSIAVIEEGLANPRYLVTSGGKAYISNWGTFDADFKLDQSYIAVVDLSNLSVIKKINTENGTEKLAIAGNKLFALNSFTNTISIIDLASETVEATLKLGNKPNGITLDNNGKVWVICGGSWEGNDGKLYAINPSGNVIEKEIELNMNTAGHLQTNKSQDKLYFTSGKSVYELPVTATVAPGAPLFTNENLGSIYSLGIDPNSNIFYLGDAVAFKFNGKVYRHEANGTAIDDFSVGIGPNGFWFR
ncbi:MAG: hypothetical protein M3512_09960 [Bacteroidota bacterium]|nr:hypothetical protein [Bacteroidota bacterium]